MKPEHSVTVKPFLHDLHETVTELSWFSTRVAALVPARAGTQKLRCSTLFCRDTPMRFFALNKCIWELVLGSRVPEVKSERAAMSALTPEQVLLLRHAGHSVGEEWRHVKFPARGVSEQQSKLVKAWFLYVQSGNSKPFWVCSKCPWQNSMRGLTRPLEHMCFKGISLKESSYIELHKLKKTSDIPLPYREWLVAYKKQGNKTSGCKEAATKDQILNWAALGIPAAVQWAIFNHWVPIDYKPCGVERPEERVPISNEEATRRQVVAFVCSGVAMNAGNGSHWENFLRYIAPDVNHPGRTFCNHASVFQMLFFILKECIWVACSKFILPYPQCVFSTSESTVDFFV